jgi:hypothetical protein
MKFRQAENRIQKKQAENSLTASYWWWHHYWVYNNTCSLISV